MLPPDEPGLFDQFRHIGHDLRDLEVLRRVDAGDAHLLQRAGVFWRDDAADDNRDIAETGGAQFRNRLADEIEVAA